MIAADRVGAVLADRLGTGPGRWELRLLGETPGLRRVLSCAFHGPSPAQPLRLVAKAYAGPDGARTARVMADVHAQLAAVTDAIVAIPKPVLYDARHRLLLQEVASGRPYPELARSAGFRAHLAAAGSALATLHGLPVAVGPSRTLRDHLRELVDPHPRTLAERLPGLGGRIAAVLAALEAGERAVGPTPAVLCHRDLHLRQLLREGRRVWVLDWDLAAAADPALDLGNLIAYMATKLPAARADACAEALLEGYADGGDRSGAVGRRRLYEAFTYLRLASKRFRLREAGWRERVEDMVTRAERALEA